MGRIMITTDSPADLPPDLQKKYNIRVAPLHVIIRSENYTDGIDISPVDIFRKYDETGSLPKTSAVSPEEYKNFFQGILSEGYEKIIHIGMSSCLSSTFGNALIASEGNENIFVADSMNLTSSLGLLVIKACELRDKGFSAKEIYQRVIEMRSLADGSFILDNLEFLHKGGRCSALASLGANVLGIKPCINIRDGKMYPGKKYRGKAEICQLKYALDRVNQNTDTIDTDKVFITATEGFCEEQIENIKKEIKKQIRFREVITATAGCVVSSHCGRNTVGVLFMRRP